MPSHAPCGFGTLGFATAEAASRRSIHDALMVCGDVGQSGPRLAKLGRPLSKPAEGPLSEGPDNNLVLGSTVRAE